MICTKPTNKKYRDGWERIYGGKRITIEPKESFRNPKRANTTATQLFKEILTELENDNRK
jgi:hypothetical protein